MTELSTPTSELVEGNRIWRTLRATEDPTVFEREARGQRPSFLFIGCADSRVPPTTITGTGPGALFVTRNIANLVRDDDPAIQSTLEYAIDVLEVPHIVVCGHTGCGGVAAALGPDALGGALGAWIAPLRHLVERRREELAGLDEAARIRRLVQLNVEAQVLALEQTPSVIRARTRRPLRVHGAVYELHTGRLQMQPAGALDPS